MTRISRAIHPHSLRDLWRYILRKHVLGFILYAVIGYVLIWRRAFRTIHRKELLGLWRYALRVLRFGAVGLIVAILGAIMLAYFRSVFKLPELDLGFYVVTGASVSFLAASGAEGFAAVNMNFLGSRYFTWADRFSGPGFWKSLWYVVCYVALGAIVKTRWLGTAWLYYRHNGIRASDRMARYAFWRKRPPTEMGFWKTWARFWRWRIVTFGINQAILNAQVLILHLPPQLAYVSGLIVAAAFNYAANDTRVFQLNLPEEPGPYEGTERRICIVAPCKGNTSVEIDAFLRCLDAQEYLPRNVQVVLVGDYDEPAFKGLPISIGETRHGVTRMRRFRFGLNLIEVVVEPGGRDSNYKRSIGMAFAVDALREATAAQAFGFSPSLEDLKKWDDDVIVLADPDIRPGPHWLEHMVRLFDQGHEFVAGPLASDDPTGKQTWRDRFWNRFIDKTTIGGKTPRVDMPVGLTMENVGQYKPPVTANLAFTRRVWRTIGEPRPDFRNSYEDYEFAWRALKAGYKIYFDPQLRVKRIHRVGLKPLQKEYFRSAKGFRDFATEYPDSPFTILRLVQLMALPLLVLAGAGAFFFDPQAWVVLACAGLVSSMLTNWLAARSVQGFLYPFIGGQLSAIFTVSAYVAVGQRRFRALEFPKLLELPRTLEWRYLRGVTPPE